jgi:polyhydroxyalkanoate synthesis regulator protein
MVPQFLAASFEMLREGQEKMMKNFSDIPNPMAAVPGFEQMQKQQQAFLETMMGKWTPGSTMPEASDEEEIAAEPDVTELDDIKKQLADLQKKLSGLN